MTPFHTGKYDARLDGWIGNVLGAFVPLPHVNQQGTVTQDRVVYAEDKETLRQKVQERLEEFKRTGL